MDLLSSWCLQTKNLQFLYLLSLFYCHLQSVRKFSWFYLGRIARLLFFSSLALAFIASSLNYSGRFLFPLQKTLVIWYMPLLNTVLFERCLSVLITHMFPEITLSLHKEGNILSILQQFPMILIPYNIWNYWLAQKIGEAVWVIAWPLGPQFICSVYLHIQFRAYWQCDHTFKIRKWSVIL